MNHFPSWWKAVFILILILFATTERPLVVRVSSAQSIQSPPCSTAEFRQFDFWLGDWDAFDAVKPDTAVARIRVHSILDGCVVHEDYQDTNGSKGQSFSIYDASRKTWHQSWVTNRGRLLIIEGTFQNGEMFMTGVDRLNGQERHARGTWKPIPGGVSEIAATSTDGGNTWNPCFDLVFRPHAKASAVDDRNLVASLDTQYQAAVKKNDGIAMDRILADDFVLVTGSGKTYTKADLLEEARSGRTVYEHQEDSAQTVRIWGDAAIVTAELWEKGTENGKPFDYTIWFTDTYVRTATGWRYVFGQSSLPLPKASQ
jgi:ketosteroid isomerase-like protein